MRDAYAAPMGPPVRPAESVAVEVSVMRYTREHTRGLVTFPPGATAGRVACLECHGSGWWGFGPDESVNGPCIECKGTGRVWVGLL